SARGAAVAYNAGGARTGERPVAEESRICACGARVEGTAREDGTVPCGACGRVVVVDAARAAGSQVTGLSVTRTSPRDLVDSAGGPLALVPPRPATPDGLTRSVADLPTGFARAAAVRVPEKLGPYRVLGRIGEGGMGVVFRGHDDVLDRPVAI